jgi:hypothetical protein
MSTVQTIISNSPNETTNYVVSLIEEAGFTTEEAMSLVKRHAFDAVQDSLNNPSQN